MIRIHPDTQRHIHAHEHTHSLTRPSSSFRGRLNSTTADWLPDVDANGGLLDRVMGSRACRDVDVVVVMVGLQDLLAIKDVDTLVALAVSPQCSWMQWLWWWISQCMYVCTHPA